MASLLVRNLPEEAKQRLRVRAARNGRSMDAEARAIIETAVGLAGSEELTLGDLVAKYFGPEHGFDLEPYLPPREFPREPPSFE